MAMESSLIQLQNGGPVHRFLYVDQRVSIFFRTCQQSLARILVKEIDYTTNILIDYTILVAIVYYQYFDRLQFTHLFMVIRNQFYWCLVGNGWEWGNGITIDSHCGSFPHSLLSTSKKLEFTENQSPRISSPSEMSFASSTMCQEVPPGTLLRHLQGWFNSHQHDILTR